MLRARSSVNSLRGRSSNFNRYLSRFDGRLPVFRTLMMTWFSSSVASVRRVYESWKSHRDAAVPIVEMAPEINPSFSLLVNLSQKAANLFLSEGLQLPQSVPSGISLLHAAHMLNSESAATLIVILFSKLRRRTSPE